MVVMVGLLVGAFAVAFYMDWLGLWTSEEHLREQREAARERVRLSREEAGGAGSPGATPDAVRVMPPL